MQKATFLLVISGLAVLLLSAAQPIKASEPDDQQAMNILQNMSKTLASAEQFSFTLHSSYDAPQANGQMVEFGAVRRIQVKRPDKLRVDKQRSDGDKRIMVLTANRL